MVPARRSRGAGVLLGDGGFVALPGTTRGLLWTPAHRSAQTADVGGMIGAAKLCANHGSHASSGPQLAPEAIGCGPSRQQGRQAGEWHPSQARWGSRGRPMSKRIRSAVPSAFHPLADRPFADAEGFGDLALGPASWLETPCL
jgi:hypothetical protein